MIKKLIAMTLALNLSLPVSLLAQETENKPKNETEAIQLLLSNIKKDNDAVKYLIGGAAGLTAAASAGYAAYIHKRLNRLAGKFAAAQESNAAALSEMQKTLLSTVEDLTARFNLSDEAAVSFRTEMVNIINSHARAINSNASSLEELLNESAAKSALRPIGFTANRQTAGVAAKTKPNKIVKGSLVSVIEEIEQTKTASPKLTSYLKNIKNIKKNPRGGGLLAGLLIIGVTVAASAILSTEQKPSLISSRRAEFEKILNDVYQNSPEALLFTAQSLAQYNAQLTASVLAGNAPVKKLFIEQAQDLLSPQTKALAARYKAIFASQEQEADKIYDIKNGLLNFDYYKTKYDFKNPIPVG